MQIKIYHLVTCNDSFFLAWHRLRSFSRSSHYTMIRLTHSSRLCEMNLWTLPQSPKLRNASCVLLVRGVRPRSTSRRCVKSMQWTKILALVPLERKTGIEKVSIETTCWTLLSFFKVQNVISIELIIRVHVRIIQIICVFGKRTCVRGLQEILISF